MSGEPPRDDEQDNLDDFIIDDARVDDLDDLFTNPAAGAKAKPQSTEPDSDDVLFDAGGNLQASEVFEGSPQFEEGGGHRWRGHDLAPDEIGIPVDAGTEQGNEAAVGSSFTEQLDSLLDGDADFGESDSELELVDDDSELVGVGSETLDGSDTDDQETFLEDTEPAADAGEFAEEPFEEPFEEVAYETSDYAEGEEYTITDAAGGEDFAAEGDDAWSPIVEDNGELEAAVGEGEEGGEEEYYDAEPEEELEVGVDEQLAYVDSRHNRMVGAPARRGGLLRLVTMAAALVILGAGGVAVLRPEWFGLRFQPAIERVQIARPSLVLQVAPPPMPVGSATKPPDEQPKQPQPVVEKPPVEPPKPAPVVEKPPVEQPVVEQPVEQPKPPVEQPVVEQPPVEPPKPAPVVEKPPVQPPDLPAPPVAVVSKPPVQPGPAPDTNPGSTQPTGLPANTGVQVKNESVFQVSDTLAIGNVEDQAAKGASPTIPAVPAGSKAFAQLHNGNFFIGSVKSANASRLTLRLTSGEVTLPMNDVEQVAALGSSEYEALQKATTGFIRLSNSNRLVGKILRTVNDDNVVLQMKSDRIIVPRAEIGEIVDQADQSLKFSSAADEDQWLRMLAERQLQLDDAARKQAQDQQDGAVRVNSKAAPKTAPRPAPKPVQPQTKKTSR
jgi:hypothetical protein